MSGQKANHRAACLMLLAVTCSLWVAPSLATLGGVATPSDVMIQNLPSKRALSSSNGMTPLTTRHQIVLANGTTVLEFSGADRVVFAVSWEGPVLPDLNALLGAYFKPFMTGVEKERQSGRRGGPLHLASDNLVVHSTGRMRNFLGYAYAPALVPANLDINDLLP